jgi:hypothetical protein
MGPIEIVRGSTVITLAALADVHAAWAFGSPFPAHDRRELADLVAGHDEMPGRAECLAVAGLLGVAAVLVADVLPVPRWVRRGGVWGVAAALGGRSALGFTGRTGSVVPWTPSDRFVALDRRWYAPLCAALAVGSIVSSAPMGSRS